ncbi:MAG: hypothetical protein A2V70_19510 [Planctomycetes bacterium RBG_13_63_9]|nr:MAG: hypothetical protein A2V70_19510 [Planctomycetes bacterium RBG_13_63_9]
MPIGLASHNMLRLQTALGNDGPEVRQADDLLPRFNQLRADDFPGFRRPQPTVRAVLYEDDSVPLEPHP